MSNGSEFAEVQLTDVAFEKPIIPRLQPIVQPTGSLDDAGAELADGIVACCQFSKLQDKAEELSTTDNNLFEFDAEKAQQSGVEREDIKFIMSSINILNKQIQSGDVNPDLLGSKRKIVDSTVSGTQYMVWVETTIFGTKYTLNKAFTTKVAQLIGAVGAGVGAVSAILGILATSNIIFAVGAAIAALIAALVALGAAVIFALDLCNGICVTFPWGGLPPVPTPAP